MKRLGFIAALLLLLVAVLPLSAQERLPSGEISRISQSVVQIIAASNGEPFSQGSGTIISADGRIYTNYHVIDGGDEFAIYMVTDPAELPELRYFASVEVAFENFDVAILQIDRDADGRSINASTLDLPFIQEADATPQLGDPVFVFGFPGIGNGFLVFTNGTITTIQNEDFGDARLPFLYQTDAEISPGNSGGTAVNLQGQFIGIPSVVQSEDRTGGRLGGIISEVAIRQIIANGGGSIGGNNNPPNDDNNPRPSSSGELDYHLDTNYGGIQLERNFDDPQIVEAYSGASQDSIVDIASFDLGDGCLGYSTAQPDYRIQWTGSGSFLRFFFAAQEANGDTVLVINQPDGSWICGDDSFNTLSPTVDVRPMEGQYDIWIASYNADENVGGYLVITEDDNLSPDNFRP